MIIFRKECGVMINYIYAEIIEKNNCITGYLMPTPNLYDKETIIITNYAGEND